MPIPGIVSWQRASIQIRSGLSTSTGHTALASYNYPDDVICPLSKQLYGFRTTRANNVKAKSPQIKSEYPDRVLGFDMTGTTHG